MHFQWTGYFIRIYKLHITFNMIVSPQIIESHDIIEGEIQKQASKIDVYAIGWHSSHLNKIKDNKRMGERNRK